MRTAVAASLLALLFFLLGVGTVHMHDVQQRCDREHGVLVRSTEGFWGYSCIEQGQH